MLFEHKVKTKCLQSAEINFDDNLKNYFKSFCVECKICLLQLIGSSLNRLTNSFIVKLEEEKV